LLRAALVVIGGIILVGAAIGALAGWRLAAILPLVFWGAILAGAVLVERWRYRPLTDQRPGRDWQATQERFVDPESGRLVTVFFNPATGERRYIAGDEKRRATRN
jgi:pimeloyl-ACP methyl ester carboxylesterase